MNDDERPTRRTLAEWRVLLGDRGAAMTDAEVLADRDATYAHARIVVDAYLRNVSFQTGVAFGRAGKDL